MLDAPDAIILCGGAGLRLRPVVGNDPKSMAQIAGRPFLELLLEQLKQSGFRRVILAVGYRQDAIRSHFGDGAMGLTIVYSQESSPLGTAGALRNAAEFVRSDEVLAMNGDSYTEAPLGDLIGTHRSFNPDVSIVTSMADGRSDCGITLVNSDGFVTAFEEKTGKAEGAGVNAGIYVLSHRALYDIPAGREVSLEKEMFPRWLEQHFRIRAFRCETRCHDIGTPERFFSAQGLLKERAEIGTIGGTSQQ